MWALGNIAGDSPKCRDLVLESGALVPLLGQLKDDSKISMLRNATWTLSNFCRGKPQPPFEQARRLLAVAVGAQHSVLLPEEIYGPAWGQARRLLAQPGWVGASRVWPQTRA